METWTLERLMGAVALEPNSERALDLLAKGALELTGSRHALIALMDDGLGCLEVRHGAGEEYDTRAKNEQLKVDASSEEGIVAFVAATGQAFQSGDVHREPRYKKLFGSTRSELAVPLCDRFGRIRGVLNAESDALDAYDEHHMAVCRAIGGIASLILERQEHADHEAALIEVGSAIDNALTEEELIDRVLHVAGEVLRFQACSVFLFDEAKEFYVLRGSHSRLRDQIGEVRYRPCEGCTGWVCAQGEPIRLEEPQKDPRWLGRFLEFPSEQIASFLAVPIVQRGKSIGAIRVIRRVSENKYLDTRFTPSDERILSAVADQVATGLENIRNLERIVRSERMIAWGELSAKSSHMIGNRVFALKGDINELSHLLSERQPDLDEIRELERSLAVNVLRIEEILQDFRDFVSATQLHREPTDLNQVVRETVEEVFPRRGPVELDLSLAQDLPPALADAKKLRRAVSELVENSLNYMETGRLRVATSRAVEPAGPDGQRLKGRSYLKIEVEDTGPGVDEASKARIFQPFYSGRVRGMGLGLSIVKGIVDAHGGEVFEEGQSGHGARFVILLPHVDRP
jgi:signal transduction histidine kinase